MNIFLDCGTNLGQGLKKFNRKLKFNDDWLIYSFEPNPACDLIKLKNELTYDVNFITKAVWIKDGEVLFKQENFDKIGQWSQLLDIGWDSDRFEEPIIVECVDFSKFVSNLPDCKIICKMDIEGSEYEVLKKMINDGTISKLTELYCEFHGVVDTSIYENRYILIDKIKDSGVMVYDWE